MKASFSFNTAYFNHNEYERIHVLVFQWNPFENKTAKIPHSFRKISDNPISFVSIGTAKQQI